MSCELEPILIGRDDFDCIGQVAKHCDCDQLCVYIREQQNLSLLPKIGQCLYNMITCWKAYSDCVDAGGEDCNDCGYTPEQLTIIENIFCGGTYEACDGSTRRHFGVKRMLIHYAYGAYIYGHGYQDTPFGVVQKANQDSLPAPLNELRNIDKKNRNSAEYYWEMTKDYLCTLKDVSPFGECICDCGCSCTCKHCQGKTKQNRGVNFKNISK